jgi:purine-cytosine permease-like protein
MFVSGALVLFPALAESVLGKTTLSGFQDFLVIGDHSIWTGTNADGETGIGLWEVAGFAWAANTITHFGLIDMALLRYAKKSIYGLCTSAGMLFGHYIAWIASGIMGAGAAVLLKSTIVELDPGDVAYRALGMSGYIIVIVAGWTTANANLYRAGLAAQAIFHTRSRKMVTFTVGCVTVAVACFPFVFRQILPLLTYAGLLVVPVGAIVFAEHVVFPRIGFTRYWAKFRNLPHSTPAIASWIAGLIFGFGLNAMQVMSFYYLFLPTWVFTILLYTLLAKLYGAAESYPEEEEKERILNEDIRQFQHEQAVAEGHPVDDTTRQTMILRWTSRACLLFIFLLAMKVMFQSPDMQNYTSNRDLFYTWAFVLTISYFATAYWVLHRYKALNPQQNN